MVRDRKETEKVSLVWGILSCPFGLCQTTIHLPPCSVMTWQENAQGNFQSSLTVVLQPASGYSQGGALPRGCINPLLSSCFGSWATAFVLNLGLFLNTSPGSGLLERKPEHNYNNGVQIKLLQTQKGQTLPWTLHQKAFICVRWFCRTQ